MFKEPIGHAAIDGACALDREESEKILLEAVNGGVLSEEPRSSSIVTCPGCRAPVFAWEEMCPYCSKALR